MNRAVALLAETLGPREAKVAVVSMLTGLQVGQRIPQTPFETAFEVAFDELYADHKAAEQATKVARKLVPFERDVLLGRKEGWGAAIGAAIESLRGHRCMDGLGNVTPFGEKVAKAVVVLERVGIESEKHE